MNYPAGWTCERTVLQFEDYLKSSVPLRDLLQVAEHLEACPECAQLLVVFRVTMRRARG